MVTHFTRFFKFGRRHKGAELNLWVLAHFTPPAIDMDCIVRVYVIPATETALKVGPNTSSYPSSFTSRGRAEDESAWYFKFCAIQENSNWHSTYTQTNKTKSDTGPEADRGFTCRLVSVSGHSAIVTWFLLIRTFEAISFVANVSKRSKEDCEQYRFSTARNWLERAQKRKAWKS